MGGLFSRPKKDVSRITEQDKAVLQLKQQRDKLKQYQKKIQIQLEKEREFAKRLIKNGKTEKAKLLLKKKRFQEQMLHKTDQQLENLERMVHDIEFAEIEVKVLEGLKSGNEALKKMHQIISVEDAERIMADTEESVEYQREIDAILSGGLTDEDNDAVLEELEALTKGEETRLPDLPEVPLPDVPKDKLPSNKEVTPAKKQKVAVAAS